ncbi:hypothetical protein [Candidatus Sororendozoicomonas aggregata]|uniref:hypothetical protein n=1 Tax=Candidatus Sororendozoicomonas aggregata TaxID=3073239 RepID=UPI002ED5E9D9
MRSESSILLFSRAQILATHLYRIIVIDPQIEVKDPSILRENIRNGATQDNFRHSMVPVLLGIQAADGRLPSAIGGRHITQSKDVWLLQGERTLSIGKGICTDHAAAAAFEFLKIVNSFHCEAKTEIISYTKHAFVVVNRGAGVRCPDQWGDDAFVIDIWFQNHFVPNFFNGVYWVQDCTHPMSMKLRKHAHRLRVEVTLS